MYAVVSREKAVTNARDWFVYWSRNFAVELAVTLTALQNYKWEKSYKMACKHSEI